MSGLLGILLLAVFIVCVILLSAGITWIVVKVSPAKSVKGSGGQGSTPAE